MIKPEHLKKGDTVAIVSLSAGTIGEPWALHKLRIAKERLERDYGLRVKVMLNALRGMAYLHDHPEVRAADLMAAFRDREVKAILCDTGGDDTVRLLPYIDFDVIRENPKIFTGFSDTTANHFMLYHAGLISYYGPSVLSNFSEYGKINDYTAAMIRDTFFEPKPTLEIPSSPYWRDGEDEPVEWKEENMHTPIPYHPEERGYEVIQGRGAAEGELLGGCLDVFIMLMGTKIWPAPEAWAEKILFLEMCELTGDQTTYFLRGLAAQGIFDRVRGVIVGKPTNRSNYEPYKKAFQTVVGGEAGRPDLPILYNVNFGHSEPICVLPYGVRCRLDADRKTLTLLEPATC